jgi:hypothetical protein
LEFLETILSTRYKKANPTVYGYDKDGKKLSEKGRNVEYKDPKTGKMTTIWVPDGNYQKGMFVDGGYGSEKDKTGAIYKELLEREKAKDRAEEMRKQLLAKKEKQREKKKERKRARKMKAKKIKKEMAMLGNMKGGKTNLSSGKSNPNIIIGDKS